MEFAHATVMNLHAKGSEWHDTLEVETYWEFEADVVRAHDARQVVRADKRDLYRGFVQNASKPVLSVRSCVRCSIVGRISSYRGESIDGLKPIHC